MSLTKKLILGSGLVFLLSSGCRVPQNTSHPQLQNNPCYAVEQEVKKIGIDSYLKNIWELLNKGKENFCQNILAKILV